MTNDTGRNLAALLAVVVLVILAIASLEIIRVALS